MTTLSVSATFFRTTEMPVSRPMIPKAVGQTPLSNLKLYHLLFLPVKKKMDTLHFHALDGQHTLETVFGGQNCL